MKKVKKQIICGALISFALIILFMLVSNHFSTRSIINKLSSIEEKNIKNIALESENLKLIFDKNDLVEIFSSIKQLKQINLEHPNFINSIRIEQDKLDNMSLQIDILKKNICILTVIERSNNRYTIITFSSQELINVMNKILKKNSVNLELSNY